MLFKRNARPRPYALRCETGVEIGDDAHEIAESVFESLIDDHSVGDIELLLDIEDGGLFTGFSSGRKNPRPRPRPVIKYAIT